ncbi:MAG: hypothetical protein GZ094_05075 [Mariniphaga sp.]|nr:hypothetical protein [Mariniphaga sp.]
MNKLISLLLSVPQWLRITMSLLYLAFIAFLSLAPPDGLPDIPLFRGADKIIHTCMYLGLTGLACWSMHAEYKPIWYYLISLFSISWGVSMEFFQYLMHMGRSFDYYDMIGNAIGTLFGVLIYILMAKQKKNLDSITVKSR